MKPKLEVLRMVCDDHAEHVISTAESAYRDCWSKLVLLQTAEISEADRFQAFISFQPTLITALFHLETYYNEVRECERKWNFTKKLIKPQLFAEEAQKLKHFKTLLDRVIDIGKTLGDAFAWIFYQRKWDLLSKHYQHQFIPRVPTRLGGQGEVEFVCSHQMFGKCFVLAHSITTFLREGDGAFFNQ